MEPESNLVVAIYDLQAVMPVPLGESSAFFYRSKLNCYNFTITDIKTKTTSCYFWHEGLGNRGAIEIGTCVYKFLQKNRFLMAMYYFVVNTLPIKSITHKFLIRGHTQNEGDSAHSIIERSVKRAKKSGPIYTPDHYVQLIRNAKKAGKPFIVNELNYGDFYDLKILSDQVALNNLSRLSELKLIRFTKTNPEVYEYKTRYDDNWAEMDCRKGRNRKSIIMNEIVLRQAYTSKISIAERKKRDLMHLLQTNIVPNYYEGFYNSL